MGSGPPPKSTLLLLGLFMLLMIGVWFIVLSILLSRGPVG